MATSPVCTLAWAEGEHWADIARDCVTQLGSVAAESLGILYITDRLAPHLSAIVDHLRLMTGIADWVGTAGFGIIANRGGAMQPVEIMDRPAMAAMTIALPPNGYRLFDQAGASGFRRQHGQWIDANQPQLGLVHADPRQQHLPAMLQSLGEASSAYLVGGLTGSRGPQALVSGRVTEGGISGVLFAGAVPVSTRLSQGCSPIGPSHVVTEARQNIVIRIDGRPALDVFKEEIGEILARNMERVAGFIFAALPVAGSDTGDYLVRGLAGIDPSRGWVAIGDRVEAGAAIMFVRRDKPNAKIDLNRMLERIGKNGAGPVAGGIYVSCVARGPNLFGADAAETRLVLDRLGPVPLIGFFANGEISHQRLYTHTGVLTVFG